MLIDHSREKLINSAIYFANNTNYCGITKLMNLLAELDFTHFKQTGRSVTGQTYFTWKRGPVPAAFYRELNKPTNEQSKDMSNSISFSETVPVRDQKGKKGGRIFKEIIAKRGFDPTHFSRRELDLLNTIAEDYKDDKADRMVRYSHLKSEPWKKAKSFHGLNCPIDYMLDLDGSKRSLSAKE